MPYIPSMTDPCRLAAAGFGRCFLALALGVASLVPPVLFAAAPVDLPQTVAVTVTTSPAGLVVLVDGVAAAAPQTYNWQPGSVHSIGTPSPQSVGAVPHAWRNWSDKGAQAHVVTVGPGQATYTASFTPAAARPGLARYAVELVFGKLRGLALDADGGCPGAVPGTDVIAGEVEGNEAQPRDGIIEYVGTLTRTTRIGHCESWRPAGSEDRWCPPVLTGVQNRVRAVITVYLASENHDEASVELTPVQTTGDEAVVTGSCTSDMRVEMLDAYAKDVEAFEIEATATRKLVDRLRVGTWQDLVQRPPNQPDGWTLKVVRKIQ